MLPRWTTGNWPQIAIPGMPGFYMRVPDTIQSTVAFIGYADKASPGGIKCIGTGFLVSYGGGHYLVTARHIAEPIGDAPFLVRLNRYDGHGSNIASGDDVKWFHHQDETVDLSAVPFMASPEHGYKCMYISQTDFATNDIIKQRNLSLGVGIGDNCYTIGLFRYVVGEKANLPLVYSSTISLISTEKIPIFNKFKDRKEEVDGCLIQSQGIHGASGSPVFVRPSILREDALLDGTKLLLQEQMSSLFLFGIVHSAWFLPPDATLRAELGAKQADSVPVGIAIVVPVARLVELLNSEELETMRDLAQQNQLAQKISINADVSEVTSLSDENHNHLEDFNHLVDVAARKRPRDDQS